MGVLGKDLFDLSRPSTHVKVQFGTTCYWLEDDPTPQPYGATLTALLNYDLQRFEETVSAFEQAEVKAIPQALADVMNECTVIPYCKFALSGFQPLGEIALTDLLIGEARAAFEEHIFIDRSKLAAMMQEQINAIRFIQKRYGDFLTTLFQDAIPEKKKGQRKKPLAEQIYESCQDAFVSGVSLGESSAVDAPAVDIQYAVLEVDEAHHELVEKLYFDRLIDFIYVEFMKGLQKGFVPKRCANCGRWFLQEPGMTFSYCGQLAPGEETLTCRDIGSKLSFREKVKNNEAWSRASEQIRDAALRRYKNAGSDEERAAIVQDVAEQLNQA